MRRPDPSRIVSLKPGDQAFVIVVLASLLALFSTSFNRFTWQQGALLAGSGLVYVLIGVFGYNYSLTSGGMLAAYFTAQILLGGVIIYLGKGIGFNALLMLPLAGQAMVSLAPYPAYTVCGGILAAYGLASFQSGGNLGDLWYGFLTFTAGLIFVMVFTQLSVNEERARKESERLADELAQANQQLRQYAVQAEELATTKERNRLAREIHDGLGHYLTTAFMEIQAARAILESHSDPQRAADILSKAQKLTQEALLDVRQSVTALRAPSEASRPLSASISGIVQECQAAGIEGRLELLGTERILSPQLQLTLYRTAQECMNNIRKHSHATQFQAVLDFTHADRVLLRVEDNGQGAENLEGGFGLLGIRERAHLLGGTVAIQSSPGNGFNLQMELPL